MDIFVVFAEVDWEIYNIFNVYDDEEMAKRRVEELDNDRDLMSVYYEKHKLEYRGDSNG